MPKKLNKHPKPTPCATTLNVSSVEPSVETLELAHALKIQNHDDHELAKAIWDELWAHPIVQAYRAVDNTLSTFDPDCPYFIARVDVEKVPKRYLTVMRHLLWRDILWGVKQGKEPIIPGVTIRKQERE